jgi:hypothetical protein
VESLVLSTAGVAPAPPPGSKVIPTGTAIVIRTEEKIDSDNASAGQRFSAEVVDAVDDLAGGVAIPAHSKAKLLIVSESGGGAGSPYMYLDLDTVNISGKMHRVFTSELKESNDKGFGKNKRTARFLGAGRRWAGCSARFWAAGREQQSGRHRMRARRILRTALHARERGKSSGGDRVALPAGTAAGFAAAIRAIERGSRRRCRF